jgi:hypothetical protein
LARNVPICQALVAVMLGAHERDTATGRPIRDGYEVIRELDDTELAEELIVAAMAPDRHRFERFMELLAEERSRRRERLYFRLEFLQDDWTPDGRL